ncbi:SHOCT domain-containing protein [Candidatus Clostridium radicumherbarum]|uniref:SHOCT domain-containing protein n=1 Tax=Candidatus Clostridium radicumherbarum TaxID=3381662 RepID=A0ABW8TQ03_9CLOT
MMFILLIIFAVLIFSIFNTTSQGNNIIFRKNENSNSAIDILDKRFASGEISEEEYIKRKTILKGK